ncbi:hypothetical protein ACFYOF_20640 [Streptomyces sp. NPDC007148]|uniref:hypothetical protein n=1 Tax=Streptomyces sp. NPDC007148 TaxID=3364775 RepID=UPI0036A47E63
MDLATCTYQEYTPGMGAAVRTTAGHPRFFRQPIGGHAKLITPTRQLLAANLPADAYEFQYRRMLNEHGIKAIHTELAAISAANGGQTLVLCCFDVLSKPGNWCHRSMLAAFWREETGEEIPELGATGPKAEPPALF